MPIVGSFAGASARAYGLGAGGVAIGDFESIASTTVGTATPTITFSSIPQTFSHLQLRMIVRSAGASSDWIRIRPNNDSSSVYSYHYLIGTGYLTFSGAELSNTSMRVDKPTLSGDTANIFGTNVSDLLDYANTNKFKTLRTIYGLDVNGAGEVGLTSSNWRSTTAITSLVITLNTGSNFAVNSSFALYGVKA
jgi:hypothetical protein